MIHERDRRYLNVDITVSTDYGEMRNPHSSVWSIRETEISTWTWERERRLIGRTMHPAFMQPKVPKYDPERDGYDIHLRGVESGGQVVHNDPRRDA